MSVPRRDRAVELLRDLLEGPTPGSTTRRDHPDDLVEPWAATIERRPPAAWLWGSPPNEELPSLRDPAAYDLSPLGPRLEAEELDEWKDKVHQAPASVIDTAQALGRVEQAYCRSSVDLTMRGGTTSGVVYPAAVCEIARSFRLRNVGGASAGAIAAAVAAAAERGRSKIASTGSAAADDPVGTSPPTALPPAAEGVFQPGFAGLADATAWFSELGSGAAPERPEFRVAQLFRPKHGGLQLFRLFTATMQPSAKSLRVLVLVLAFGGGLMRLLRLLAIVLATAVAARAVGADSYVVRVLAGFTLLLVGTVVLAALMMVVGYFLNRRSRVRQSRRIDPRVAEPVAISSETPSVWHLLLPLSLLLLAAGAGTALLRWDRIAVRDVSLLLLTWLIATGFQVLLPLVLLFPSVTKAKSGHFGLIGGSTLVSEISGPKYALLNKVAGLRTSPVEHALVPWLSGAMTALAGVSTSDGDEPAPMSEATVLRFGHLWSVTYEPPRADAPPEVGRFADETKNPRARLVNLELMTSELTHQVPWRFPLAPEQIRHDGEAQLYVSKSDLDRVFPTEVVAAMIHQPCMVANVRDMETGAVLKSEDLFELPNMCDIPVIFPTRMSLAFPGLFEAVRMYQRVRGPQDDPHLVRDEYGARLGERGRQASLSFPGEPPDDPDTLWLQELWFTDGGVTANFPVHFFDSVMPLWPTLGINLGAHPAGHAHQDVWLPADNQSRTLPPTPVRDAMTSFVGSIFNTARGWRDTYQTSMPAFRGRVAWVRQRSNEGGNNLFMTPDLIASLALRGALAGRRLRRRFAQDAYWHRHQWLRLRIAADNLERLRQEINVASMDPTYQAFAAGNALDGLKTRLDDLGGDPTPASPPHDPGHRSEDGEMEWFESAAATYWSELEELLANYKSAIAGPSLRDGTPSPRPFLSQIPPV
jgi:predicted acylesterase/phospholipase RssA